MLHTEAVQITLQVDHRLLEQLDAAARRQATTRVALVSDWLDERLAQEAALGTADKAL
jgi:hypothetical protein